MDRIAAMNLHDLRHYIRVYDDALDASLCAQMIEAFAALESHQVRNGRGVRGGLDNSAWTELNVDRFADAGFRALFRDQVDRGLERYNLDIGLTIALPNSPTTAELRMKRYRPGQSEQFELHFDAIYEKANRYLVYLWYLNDVEEGGETLFPKLDFAVQPKAGRLLMFPPYWMYQHEGAPPVSGDKYIVGTYLLFAPFKAR
jgi:prolyl 4-hydroxylase